MGRRRDLDLARRTAPVTAAVLLVLPRVWAVAADAGYLDAGAWELAWRGGAAPFLVAFACALPGAALFAAAWRALERRDARLALLVPALIVPAGQLAVQGVGGGAAEADGRSAMLLALVASCVAATVLSPSAPRRLAGVLAAPAVLAVLGTALRFVPLGERASWPERPNVILVSVDTQRADHLSCYGYDRPTSPEIDRFAGRAVRFTRAFTPFPFTLVAHMSLFTSLNPRAHGVQADRALAPGIPTLAQLLRDAGYRTAAVLDDVVWLDEEYAFDRGFDVYLRLDGSADVKRARIAPLLDDLGDGPFFLFLHFFDVHSDVTDLPYDSLEDYRRAFAGDYDGDFTGCSPDGVCASKYLKEMAHRGIRLHGEDLEYLIALYDAGVRTFDREAGLLFDELESRGLFDTSVTVITADHGEAFFEHGFPLHGGIHEEVVRVPLLVRTPDVRAARVVDEVVGLVDVAPTLLELCGVEPLGMQGESFVDLLEGTPRSGRRDWVLLDDGTGGVAGLRTARWKLMRSGGTRWRLYDLERDPGEKVDLLAQGVEPPPELDAMKAVVERELLRHAEFRRGLGAQADVRRGEGERARLEALGYADEPGP